MRKIIIAVLLTVSVVIIVYSQFIKSPEIETTVAERLTDLSTMQLAKIDNENEYDSDNTNNSHEATPNSTEENDIIDSEDSNVDDGDSEDEELDDVDNETNEEAH